VPQVPGYEDRPRRGGNLEEGDIVLTWEHAAGAAPRR
jgi:hypothetical protein